MVMVDGKKKKKQTQGKIYSIDDIDDYLISKAVQQL